MTAEIINLKQVRKARARERKETDASINRAAFGRLKAERTASEREAARADRALDLTQRETGAKTAANQGGFPSTAAHADEDIDPGTVS